MLKPYSPPSPVPFYCLEQRRKIKSEKAKILSFFMSFFFLYRYWRSVRGGTKIKKSQLPVQRCYNFAFKHRAHPSKKIILTLVRFRKKKKSCARTEKQRRDIQVMLLLHNNSTSFSFISRLGRFHHPVVSKSTNLQREEKFKMQQQPRVHVWELCFELLGCREQNGNLYIHQLQFCLDGAWK